MYWIFINALLTLVAGISLFSLFKHTRLSNLKYIQKQIIIGLVMGVCSYLATLHLVKDGHAVISLAMAAPTSAGLFFGAPAGIISAVIGAVSRWFATPWNSLDFTRVPEVAVILLGGILGGTMRKHMVVEKKYPTLIYTLVFGTALLASYALIILPANIHHVEEAFDMLKVVSLPLFTGNMSVFLLTNLGIIILEEKINFLKPSKRNIAEVFQKSLFYLILVALVCTALFISFFGQRVARDSTRALMNVRLQSLTQEIQAVSDEHLLNIAHLVALELKDEVMTDALLDSLCRKYEISEINIIDTAGFIRQTTSPRFIGFDMRSGEQSKEFLEVMQFQDGYVQPFRKIAYDNETYMRYAAWRLPQGGFVQVAANSELYDRLSVNQFSQATRNLNQGLTDRYVLLDENWKFISDNHTEDFKSFIERMPHEKAGKLYLFENEDTSYYYTFTEFGHYKILSAVSKDEMMRVSDVSAFITIYMLLLIFVALFFNTFILTRRLIIDNICKLNNGLENISKGELNTEMDVRNTVEFNNLSNNINTTVNTLKEFIHDAETRIDMELTFAKSIQQSALPSYFYPDHKCFEIHALMETAREVGGDFYDFYFLDESHIAILMADVSDKGIPAAMFMMESKAIIKSFAERNLPVNEIFTKANEQLCQNNEAGMFVTAWMGIVDLSTGKVQCSNAAHTKAAVCRNGVFSFVKADPALMLAGMDDTQYGVFDLQLQKDDIIFLYTDGVTEATNVQAEMYGEKRLLSLLNRQTDKSMQELCEIVKKDVLDFAGAAEQFDDITMLAFKLGEKKKQ